MRRALRLLCCVIGALCPGVGAIAATEDLPDTQRILVNLSDAGPQPPELRGPPGRYAKRRGYRQSAAIKRKVRALSRDYRLERIDGWPMHSLGLYCTVFEVPAGESAERILDRLARDPGVESAQKLNRFRTQARRYNDVYHDLQTGFAAIDAASAHRWVTGEGVRIGVVDTGVAKDHPDLEGRVVGTHSFVARQQAKGGNRHGTAVAGVIAANADNTIGIAGVAPNAELVSLKACWEIDRDTGLCDSFTLARALDFAIRARLHVVNLSLAGPADALLERLIQHALERDIAIVAAIDSRDRKPFPAAMAGVIAVAANGDRPDADWPADLKANAVFAPGRDIVSPAPPSAYDFFSGSSLAAAHVSGILALMREQAAELSAARLAEALLRSSRTHSGGARSVNACRAVSLLRGGGACAETVEPRVSEPDANTKHQSVIGGRAIVAPRRTTAAVVAQVQRQRTLLPR